MMVLNSVRWVWISATTERGLPGGVVNDDADRAMTYALSAPIDTIATAP